jgi:starch-binding outer membrane protein, SusD/RagB family
MTYLRTLLLSGLFLTGCSGLLEEDPQSLLPIGAYYNTTDEATRALLGVYNGLQPLYSGANLLIASELATDALKTPAGGGGSETGVFDSFRFDASNSVFIRSYQSWYQLINAANALLDGLAGKNVGTAQPIIEAEAKALRALAYYQLVELFGPVPLRTTAPTSVQGLDLARKPVADIYALITDDLVKAVAALPETSASTGRINKFGALALLGKVYLTQKKPTEAIAAFEQIIGKRSLYTNYADVFRIANENNTTEAIFDVQYGIRPENNDIVQYYGPAILTTFGQLFGGYAADDNAAATFATTDKRRDATLWNNSAGRQFGDWYVRKFNDALVGTTQATDAGQINMPVVRYADVLLLYAEALNAANNGPTAAAYRALNDVRTRAGLAILPTGLSQAAFTDALLAERQLELLGEGHRWFDLKRMGRLGTLAKFGFATGKNDLFPIPRAELDANKNMTQNLGY